MCNLFHAQISTSLQPHTKNLKKNPHPAFIGHLLLQPFHSPSIKMSSPTSQSAAQLAQINSLRARLSAVKANRVPKLEAISQLKTRHANKYLILCDFRNELDQKDWEARLAYSSNQLRDYRYKLEEIHNIGLQRACTMREWTELGIQTQEACEELRLLNEEICKLEHILDAHKTLSGGMGGGI